ncbi:MAG: hypothetical protein KFF73_17715 [Cyclobacteriaceae bacterium]|nr:hypothetical protein [Cyclobacteriaceae bacterium]
MNSSSILVNQTLVNEMGWINPVGEKLITFEGGKQMDLSFRGVLKDFNFESLHHEFRPLLIRYGNTGSLLSIKYDQDPSLIISLIDKTWKQFAPDETGGCISCEFD